MRMLQLAPVYYGWRFSRHYLDLRRVDMKKEYKVGDVFVSDGKYREVLR